MSNQIRSIPKLPARHKDAHKGSCGRVLIVGGSQGMIGAPCLAGRAAVRGGAGLVKVAVPESLWDVAAIKLDECLTAGLPESEKGVFAPTAGACLGAFAAWSDVVVLGPGLGTASPTFRLIRTALEEIPRPIVLDADGLNAFSGRITKIAKTQASNPERPLILTPHPGEMARLLNQPIDYIENNRQTAALQCAQQAQAVVILKGPGSIVTDGTKVYINKTGNPGMASGGTGDVLAGLIGALLGQKMCAFDAARLGVYLHGLAADLAAQRFGVWSLCAGDLIDAFPQAFKKHSKQGRPGV